MKERDDLQALVNEYAEDNTKLNNRVYSKVRANASLPVDVVNRLHHLEDENVCLKKEKDKLSNGLRAAEHEIATLRDSVDKKTRKAKGANKKVKSAKEVVIKEEEKDNIAISDSQRRAKSEQNMRKEKRDALAACAQQQKLVEDLRAELEIEQSESVHLRETEGTDSNNTTVVIPMTLLIRRQDYLRIQDILECNRLNYVDKAKEWYDTWKKAAKEEEAPKVVGADYVDDEKKRYKLYDDMIEDGFMMTGAEHDGWRSMRGLEATCRRAEEHYNAVEH